jgi:hypothetical protein
MDTPAPGQKTLKQKIADFHTMLQGPSPVADQAHDTFVNLDLIQHNDQSTYVTGSLEDLKVVEEIKGALRPFLTKFYDGAWAVSLMKTHGMINGAMISFPVPSHTLALCWFPETRCGVVFFDMINGLPSSRVMFVRIAKKADPVTGKWQIAAEIGMPSPSTN